MRIAITTWHKGPNPGTFFQCYGLYSYLRSRGHDVKIIAYEHVASDFIPRGIMYYIQQPWGLIMRKIKRYRDRKKEQSLQILFTKQIKKRNELCDALWASLPMTAVVQTQEQFEALNKVFDTFIVGSDQVWNATMLNRRYFLDYVHSDKIKAACGPSVGVCRVFSKQRQTYKNYVKSFNYVAVREKLLCDILNEEIPTLNAQHLLDPSMLCSREEYLKMAILPANLESGKYVVCYFTPNNKQQESIVRKYATEHNLKIVVMAMFGYSWTMRNCITLCPDPKEFLGCIANAATVFTSSFHCTIFSLLFHRDLYVFQRKSLSKSEDISIRYLEQLQTYEIPHRYIKLGEELNEYHLQPIDYEKVESIFQQRLSESHAFLNQFC